MRNLLIASILLLPWASCDSGGGGTTTPAPSPPPAPAPPPPPPPEPPAAPTDLAVSQATEISITWIWTAVDGADGYAVQVNPDDAFDDSDMVHSAEEPTYTVTGLEPRSSVYLRVASTSGTGDALLMSDWTDPVGGMTAPPPPNIAGDWLLVFDPGTEVIFEPSEGCFVEWRHGGIDPDSQERERIFRLEQAGLEISGFSWGAPFEVSEERPWPPDLETAPPGWRLEGAVDEQSHDIVINALERWSGPAGAIKRSYPYESFSVPTDSLMAEQCPEYSGQNLTATAWSLEWSLTREDDGTLSGTMTGVVRWDIGEFSWTETAISELAGTRME